MAGQPAAETKVPFLRPHVSKCIRYQAESLIPKNAGAASLRLRRSEAPLCLPPVAEERFGSGLGGPNLQALRAPLSSTHCNSVESAQFVSFALGNLIAAL